MTFKFIPSTRVASLTNSVWSEFTALANKHGAVNLGQGFPDLPTASLVRNAIIKSVDSETHQYSHTLGLPRLRKALASTFSPCLKRELNPDTEILVTSGATEALTCAMQAILHPGDHAIIIEPFYDLYSTNVTFPYGEPIFVPMRPVQSSKIIHSSDWTLDMKELESAITPKTKVILINSPHNPTGKILSHEELDDIAKIAKKHGLIVISDEVYDRITYDGKLFTRIATLPDMWERTLTVGSAGKTFSVTGWRVGWVLGPASLLRFVAASHSRTTFCAPTPLQDAVATCLEGAEKSDFFEKQSALLQAKRDSMIKVLDSLGLTYTIPEGSYFILVNIDNIIMPGETHSEEANPPSISHLPHLKRTKTPTLNEPKDTTIFSSSFPGFPDTRDFRMCQWLVEKIQLAAIPASVFYSPEHAMHATAFIRLCFSKKDETLEQAREKLEKLRPYIIK